MVDKLNLFMNSIKVGSLEKLKGKLQFKYEDTWFSHPASRAISLSMPLSAKVYTGDVVYHFFDNLLPDNPVIRKRIQVLFHTNSVHVFDLLASIGKDCIGAIQLLKEGEVAKSSKIEGDKLSNSQIENTLKNYKTSPLGMSNADADFRISLAGAQEKSAFLKYKNQWHKPTGTTPTSHIFKLPIGMIEHQSIDLRDSCENEWLCLKIIEAFGLKVAKAEIEYFNNSKVLVVERFDRKWSDGHDYLLRLPQEDLCQALGKSSVLKYQADGGPGIKDIMDFLLGSQQALQDRNDFFKIQLIFFLLAAIDGHAKNFSIFIRQASNFQLTPIYDVISAFPMMHKKQLHQKKIKMAMAIIGKNNHYDWSYIYRRHFLSTAKFVKFSVKQAEDILDKTILEIDNVINQVSSLLPQNFPSYISDSIFTGMLKAKQRLVTSHK